MKSKNIMENNWVRAGFGVVTFTETVAIITCIVMIFYKGIFPLKGIFGYIMSLVLHFSVVRYMVKNFFRHEAQFNLSDIIFRFAASMLGMLISAKTEENVIFLVIAIIVLIVPYMAGDITQVKRCNKIAIAVSLLMILLTVFRMRELFQDALWQQTAGAMKIFLCLDKCNQLTEWISITILYFIMQYKNKDMLAELSARRNDSLLG